MYDFMLELLIGKWSDFINSFSPDEVEMEAAKKVQVLFENQYLTIGATMFLLVAVTWVLYYLWLNNLPGLFYKSKYWTMAGICCTVLTGIVTFFIIKLQIDINIPFTRYLIGIVLINCVYSMIAYFLFSIFLNGFTNAKTTPFKLF
ncbi:hypothetical protein [uncultured Bacteroides sp.]|uniref:hypothetical protein n=1 Tax=uncultured Bacteroides sp. TaxID=162156 RepID=UPI002AA75BD7|nr:hypothetical protein [uncultured Bacteroides sp.]